MSIIKRILAIVLILNSISCYSQNYKQYSVLRFKVKYFLKQQKLDSAIIIYDQLFSDFGKLLPYDNSDALKTFSLKKDTSKTIFIIKDMMKNGQSLNEIIEEKDSILAFAKISKSWDTLKFIKPEIDYNILLEIDKWLEVDQFVRNHYNDSCIIKFMFEVDSVNFTNVIELINKQGFPGFNKLGVYSNDLLFLIMHFTTNLTTEKYWESYFKPLLLSEATKGNISFSDIAMITDRFQNYKKGTQIYGFLNNRTEYDIPIENIKEVDVRRAELGLPKLYIDAKIKNLKLPKDYKF